MKKNDQAARHVRAALHLPNLRVAWHVFALAAACAGSKIASAKHALISFKTWDSRSLNYLKCLCLVVEKTRKKIWKPSEPPNVLSRIWTFSFSLLLSNSWVCFVFDCLEDEKENLEASTHSFPELEHLPSLCYCLIIEFLSVWLLRRWERKFENLKAFRHSFPESRHFPCVCCYPII